MLLKLTRKDLHQAHRNIETSQTEFHHFNEEAQAAIRVVGKAMYYNVAVESDLEPCPSPLTNYNTIFPPKRLKRGLKRMWINQPSTHDTHHEWHGKNVLFDELSDPLHPTIYFLNGIIHNMIVDPKILSEGWK
jgi:hypothetical protein